MDERQYLDGFRAAFVHNKIRMALRNLGASAQGSFKPHVFNQAANRFAFGVAENASARRQAQRLRDAPALLRFLHSATNLLLAAFRRRNFAFKHDLIEGNGCFAIVPLDIPRSISTKALPGPQRGDRDNTRPQELSARTGIHTNGTTHRARNAHGEFQIRTTKKCGLSNSLRKPQPRPEREHARLGVEYALRKTSAQGNNRAVKTSIGNEQIGTFAEHRPRNAELAACIARKSERTKVVRLDKEGRGAADSYGGMSAQRLVFEHKARKLVA